jgi:RHH-type proline utilization regulon transcriptional repressor/proline dehydrogenase/delta 1-pyrroline-5-carboxylate dehydrogenase
MYSLHCANWTITSIDSGIEIAMSISTNLNSDSATENQPFAAFHAEVLPEAPALRAAITAAYRYDERQAVQWLQTQVSPNAGPDIAIRILARNLVESVRAKRTRASGVDALMHEFSLSSEEGVALMCLAEALLRIPDHYTADRLIADKIGKGDWRRHLRESPSLFVNAATWSLLITGKMLATANERHLGSAIVKLIAKGGEPLIRKGMNLAMKMLGNQFVTGQTIAKALENSYANEVRGYRYSYDMLGEAALTEHDAARYFASYEQAIHAIGRTSNGRGIKSGPGISVKLSALHPRYSRSQRTRAMHELLPRLKQLLLLAKQYDIGLNIDAEEADRLELSLDLLETLVFDTDLNGFEGIGFVVQAYQKRCPFVLDYLIDLASRSGQKLMIRLVKGAYWDSEIKRAQIDGLSYPVYTRKTYTDMSYLVCAQKLLARTDVIYPQFATHNAHAVASIYTWAQYSGVTDYEFQCLHGMGETLYDQVVGTKTLNIPCRIYAPVGSHQTLLAYLVRRLLENGANSSFVNQIIDENIATDSLITDPFDVVSQLNGEPHPNIVLPIDLYGSTRKNSVGVDLNNEDVLRALDGVFQLMSTHQWQATPLLSGSASAGLLKNILNPADRRDIVGQVIEATAEDVETALEAATNYAATWQGLSSSERATILVGAAELLQKNKTELMALAVREAGKSLANAVAEVREAIDYLHYYAAQVQGMPNTSALGVIACISPWNFPLAIFIGEISAALAAGNVVLAKPAEQTPLIAFRAVQLLHEAGIPRGALQLLPGRGDMVGARLVADAQVRGVLFTGSTNVAQSINKTLAARAGWETCDIPLIAETGGQNAMIVDSSALPEQVVQDVMSSAFDSAGQRCSALRVLCLQAEIADQILAMLKGAMQELQIGNPDRLATDIGPVIDADAKNRLVEHIKHLKTSTKSCYQLPLPTGCEYGTFFPPTVLEIDSLTELTHEVFGPVLHVIRYSHHKLPQLIDAINATEFGLTLGIHSRIDETIDFITLNARVGNIYVNRNIVGAIVGVQPFGGEGKSGTGPKAAGPFYLKRLQRNPDFKLDTTYRPAITHPAKLSNEVLENLLTWAKDKGYKNISRMGEHYLETTLIGMILPLPGPTGEHNELSFAPHGIVLCAATNIEALLNQLIAVLATGNTPAIAATSAKSIPADLPSSVRNMIRLIDNIETSHLDLALAERADIGALRLLLAKRDGAIVNVIETQAALVIPLWRLIVERAVCVNTSAAGGNASLMTLGN